MIKHDFDLASYNTFGISKKAKRFGRFSSIDELTVLLNTEYDRLIVLGGGSNMLLTQDLEALVIRNEMKGLTLVNETDSHVFIKAGAGEVWHDLVMFCVENNYGGLENLSLIPGSVGASPMQNIGAYGVEIKDVFFELEAFEIASQSIKKFTNEACAFGYRESVFKRALKDQFIITSVTFQLTKSKHVLKTQYGAINDELLRKGIDTPTIRAISNAVIAIRQSKLPDPKVLGNAGSFFKNPVISKEQFEQLNASFPLAPNYPATNGVKLAAGWLIEQVGWKGKQVGNCGVHSLQALVLVNYGGATGEEVLALSAAVIKSVEDKFGVTLEREVNIL
jgi:UDP-N-acetylmuramate dehydrogenase